MRRLLAGVVALALAATPVLAQSGTSVRQSGASVNPNTVPYWVTNGVIGSQVTAADSPVTSFGVTSNGGAGFCVNSDRITAAGRNQLCLGVQTSGPATISLQNQGTAPAENLQFIVNGTVVSIPLGGSTIISGNGPFTPGDFPCFLNSSGIVQDCHLGTISLQNASAVAITGGTITGLPSPAGPTDAAIKSYVDSVATGLNILASSRLATSAALPNTPTYANGSSGVGATLTAGSNSTLTVDGSVANLNDVVLVKNQATPSNNGIYTVTTAGSGSVPWVLTRATYFNTAAQMKAGSYTFVTAGSANINTAWTMEPAVVTVGTDPLNFVLFSTVTSISSVFGRTGAVVATSGDYNSSQVNTTSSLTGGVLRTQLAKNGDSINLLDLGAKCDGSTDDTTVIANAIANVPSGVTLVVPPSSCKVSGGFTITQPVIIQGSGPASTFTGTLGGTTDLFHVFPNGVSLHKVWFQDFVVSITGGKNIFNFDSSQAASSFVAESGVRRVNTMGSTTLAGASISAIGNSGATSYPFDLSFEDDELISGAGTATTTAAVYLNHVGDSIRVLNGEITGPSYGVYLNQVPGAGEFVMSGGSNFTACGGVFITASIFAILRDLEIEFPGTCAGGSYTGFPIFVSDPNAFNPSIEHINITLDSGVTGYGGGIEIFTGTNAWMNDIKVVNASALSAVGITTAAGSTGAVFGPRFNISGFSASYSDSGASTTHVALTSGHP